MAVIAAIREACRLLRDNWRRRDLERLEDPRGGCPGLAGEHLRVRLERIGVPAPSRYRRLFD